MHIPQDITDTLHHEPIAKAIFERLEEVDRKNYIEWIVSAPRPSVRERRLKRMVEMLRRGQTRKS